MKLAVLGAGAWGTALAISFFPRHQVTLWGRNPQHLDALRREHANARYLPGISIPTALAIEPDLEAALRNTELVLIATSTNGFAPTLEAVVKYLTAPPLLWVCKGFETSTERLPHEIATAYLGAKARIGALSGPSFALEVAQGKPAALTLASPDAKFGLQTAASLNGPALRIYSSQDLVGVELGGALKNVMAIAAGISDGLGLGNNARAALVTRGLAEMVRLGVAMGGQPETFMGLTGLGDLVLTATGDLSRNRSVGKHLAEGKKLDTILAGLGHVAEGVFSARAALNLARKYAVDMPITEAVCAVLFEGAVPVETVRRLLARDPKAE
jgi:glycerol-3-phosphate dehydrogenase (NAD(P)+)